MNDIDGGELVGRSLKAAGIDVVFALHGGHLDNVFQSLNILGIKIIDTRQEAAAGHAAEGYCRSTGKVAVALATAGPGFTNIVTSITNSQLDCLPIVYLVGAPPLRDAETNPLQGGFDQVAIAKPITKWAHRVTQADRIPNLVARALQVAQSGRPGPVVLELPVDVIFSKVSEAGVTYSSPFVIEKPAPAAKSVDLALKMLAEAERPVIMVGAGALKSNCSEELLKFVESSGIPVFSNLKAHGLLPWSHRLSGHAFSNIALLEKKPDCVLLLGARLGLYTGGSTDAILPFDCKIVEVNVDAEEFGRVRVPDLAIVADCKAMLSEMNASGVRFTWPDFTNWQSAVGKVKLSLDQKYAGDLNKSYEGRIHPFAAARAIMEMAGDETYVVADGGEAYNWMESAMRAEWAGQFMTNGYLGCLGTGQPTAMGVQYAHPDKRVFCVTGDGAVGFNISEFDTMVRHDLPIITIVFNNMSWGLSLHGQAMLFSSNQRVIVDLLKTDYDKVAAGFGCYGETVSNIDDLKAAIQRALDSGKPACLNVIVDQDIVAPITEALVGTRKNDHETVLPYYDNLQT